MSERRTQALQLAAELALLLVTMATAFGFRRLFEDNSFLFVVMGAAVGSHLIAGLTRRVGWGIGRSALASAAGLVLFVTWTNFLDSTAYGFPTGATIDALRADADAAWLVFQDVLAPAPVEPGFVIALAVGIWLAGFLADWAAFRLWSPVEAVVPASALFLFASLLGADRDRVACTAIFLAAVFSFELLHHVAKQLSTRHWINADAEQGGRSLVAGGAVMAALAVLTAVLIGPALPGAEDPPVIEWRDIGDDSPARVTVSPMVSIRSQLVDQPDVEVFTVETDQPAYWRLTALDEFDGEIWKSSGSFEDVDGTLPRTGVTSGGTSLAQTFRIGALKQLWLPAAFQPVRIDAPDVDVVYETESSTLIVSNDRTTSDGLTYDVESVAPQPDLRALEAGGDIPSEITERFLGLPDTYNPDLVATAEEITAGAADDYQKALALQTYFRAFTYDQEVALNHDIDSIEKFLEVRSGYCEQFAGAFAAFARSLGIPARVAVGFTWGSQDASNPRLYHVTGRNAHAWPEVWLAGAGWVPFEPTPGRGNPQAESITNVEAAQAVAPGGVDTTTPSSTPDTTPDSVPIPEQNLEPDTAGIVDTGNNDADTDGPQGTPVWARLLAVIAALAVLGAIYAAIVVTLKRFRLRRRRRAVDGTSDRIRLAWLEATEHLAVAGIVKRPSETHAEYVRRVTTVTEVDPETLERLATLASAADYADRAPSDAEAAEAEAASGRVEVWVTKATTLWERGRAILDPRPLLPQRRARVVAG